MFANEVLVIMIFFMAQAEVQKQQADMQSQVAVARRELDAALQMRAPIKIAVAIHRLQSALGEDDAIFSDQGSSELDAFVALLSRADLTLRITDRTG